MKSALYFADDQVRQSFLQLRSGRAEEKEIYDQLNGVFDIIATDPFCGSRSPNGLSRKFTSRNTGLTTFGNLISIRTGG